MASDNLSATLDAEAAKEAATNAAQGKRPKEAYHAPTTEPPPPQRIAKDEARARISALGNLGANMAKAKKAQAKTQMDAAAACEKIRESAELSKPCISINVAEWMDEPDEPDNPLIFGLVEVGSYVALVGPAKAAKSWLALQLVICIAAGVDFMGRKVKRQRALYFNAEISPRQIKKRLRSICKRLGINPQDLDGWLFISNMRGHAVTFDDCYWEARRRGVTVVIIDPFYQVFKGQETNEKDCQEATEEMKRFLAAGMTLIIVFHSPKGYAADRQIVDMISGSSVLARFPENVIAILPHATNKDARVVDCSVLRDYAPPDPFAVKFDEGALVLAPEIKAELKSGYKYGPRKSPEERQAEKIERDNKAIASMTETAAAFIEKRGANMPNSTELSDMLKRKYPRPLVEGFLKSIKAGSIAGLASVRELWRKPKTGEVMEKPSKSGGKVFITTPEKAAAYAEHWASLPLK